MKWLIQIAVLAACGCANSGPQRTVATAQLAKVDAKVVEKAAAQVHATGIALKAAPQTNRAVQVAQVFNEKAKVLLPQPIYEDAVKYEEIVAGLLSTNQQQRAEAQKQLGEKDSEISSLQSERRVITDRVAELEGKLIELGQQHEAEKNKSWWTRIYATLGLGGIIALCVAFPILIPIGGQLLGSLVSAAPSLASFFGVVGRRAFDSVVTGIESAKGKMKADGKDDALAVLSDELYKETDADHRRLIADRKQSLNL